MGTKYSSTLPTGYNSNPPADDGSQVASNKVKYSTIKSKLADPFNDFASALDTALQAAFDTSSSITSVDYTTVASDHLKPIEASGTTTISLGDAATMGSGYQPTIVNAGTALVTVALATNTDTLNGIVDGSVTLNPHMAMTFTVNKAADGYSTISYYDSGNRFTSVSADKTLAAGDFPGCYDVTAASKTITLPAMSGVVAGVPIVIVNSSTGEVTIAPDGTDEIDGDNANYVMPVGARIAIVGTGSAAEIISGRVQSGDVLQAVSAVRILTANTTQQIPLDDTIPQKTEGSDMLDTTITPKSATSKLLIEINAGCVSLSGTGNAVFSLFVGTGGDAAGAALMFEGNNSVSGRFLIDSPGLVSTAIQLRAGPTSALTLYINSSQITGNRLLGGVATLSMTITEIAA